ncbi:MAG: Mov34/MPN/PAD-1 family protein [Armatimonadetes bacterium]|nr:Mov34/MPN/PAD-1 family protein [Armatimonadota bacterium]
MRSLLKAKSISAPRVVISRRAYANMCAFRQRANESEAGGILIGAFFPTKNEYHVCVATRPSRFDRRGRYFFHRDAKNATRIARRFWSLSDGQLHYLGEWHSHPEPVPRPSITDKITMGRLRKDSTTVAGCLMLVIIGQETDWIGFWSESGYSHICFEIADE